MPLEQGNNTSNIGYGPRITVKEFDGDPNYYDIWEDSFIGCLRLSGIHFALDQYASVRPATFDMASAKSKIYDYLTSCLDRTSHGLIKRGAHNDGVEGLKLLRNYYLRDTEHRTYSLWRSLMNLKIEDRTIAEYLRFIDETVAQLKEANEAISNGLLITATLDGLTESFSTFIAVANHRSPAYTYETLKIALLNEEERLKKETNVDTLFAAKKVVKCTRCGLMEHYASSYNSRYSSNSS